MKRGELHPEIIHHWLKQHQGEPLASTLEAFYQHSTQWPQDRPLAAGVTSSHHLQQVLEALCLLNVDPETWITALLYHAEQNAIDLPEVLREKIPPGSLKQLQELKKLDRFQPQGELSLEQDSVEGLRRLLLALIRDIRVVLVVLSEQLVRMRALLKGPEDLLRAHAQLTRHIHAPLANRLGIWQLKWELEDLAFRALQPETYKHIARMLAEKRKHRESFIQQVKTELQQLLDSHGIRGEVQGRPKHIFSIWKKMQQKNLSFEQLYDVRAVRILVDSVGDCYTVLGLVHGRWQPIPGEFDDYIAMPKANNYQSLHTAVVGPGGRAFEIQIRTHEMHEHAEKGVAAHWRYKEGNAEDPLLQKKINWMRALLEQKDEVSDQALLQEFQQEQDENRVYVLTPKGKVIDLSAGSTVLDFAYHIHTEIGHRCIGAKVNGRIVPLTTVLETGQQVEILTRKEPRPSRDWLVPSLGYLKNAKARSKVRQWFKQIDREQNLKAGEEMLQQVSRTLHLDRKTQQQLVQAFNFHDMEDLAIALGQGEITIEQVARKAEKLQQPQREKLITNAGRRSSRKKTRDSIHIRGVGNLLTKKAQCCNPLPGDEIIGWITRGQGVSIHKKSCSNMRHALENGDPRLIEVEWGEEEQQHQVEMVVHAYDRKGLLKDLSTVLNNMQVFVEGVHSEKDDASGEIHFHFTLSLGNLEQLALLHSRLAALPNVIAVERTR